MTTIVSLGALTPAQAISPGGLLHHDFLGPSWDRWRAILRAAFAEPMTAEEEVLFREVADRDPPRRRVRELWIVAGRRAGKDSIAAAIATIASLQDYSACLRTGERASIMCLATDRVQAGIVHRYVGAYFEALPDLQPFVTRQTDDTLELSNSVEIVITANNTRAPRGRSVAIAILDEVGYWRSTDSAAPDTEVFAAIEPATLTIPGAMIIGISSPHRRKGLLFEKWRRHYGGDDDDVLVVRGPSRTFNPTLPQSVIDARLEADPEAGAAEYLAEWRNDLDDFVDRALIESAVDHGVVVRPPMAGSSHTAFCDPSGGRGSSFAVAVVHAEGDMVILDALLECRAPFSPSEAMREATDLVRAYSVSTVVGDRWGADWVTEAWAAAGSTYTASERDKSALFLDALPLFTAGRIRLLDHPRLAQQLASLERRVSKFGRDKVGVSDGADDLANVVAGAAVNALADKPALVHHRALLAAKSVPVPHWAELALCTMAMGPDGTVATAYFAQHRNPGITDPAFLTLIDCTMEPLQFGTMMRMAGKLREVRDSIANPPPIWVACVPPSLIEQVHNEGFLAEVYDDRLLSDLPALALFFGSAVHSGQFKVATPAAAKASSLPLASALSFRPGERVEDNPLRLALLYGVGWALTRD